jgi:hypothetical protein
MKVAKLSSAPHTMKWLDRCGMLSPASPSTPLLTGGALAAAPPGSVKLPAPAPCSALQSMEQAP